MKLGTKITFMLVLGIAALAPRLAVAQDTGTRKVLSRVVPVYPELARSMNISGTVKLQVTIAPNGRAKTIQVVGGHPVLAKAASDAVDKWRWEPSPHESTEMIELAFRPQ
jgi:TonB family protein